jgi:hypothetical protein
VEVDDGSLVLANQDSGGPYGVKDHQHNDQRPGRPVNVESLPTRHLHHHPCSGAVKDKPTPEEDQMPTCCEMKHNKERRSTAARRIPNVHKPI